MGRIGISMSQYRYEVDELNAVRIWDDENSANEGLPFIYQPHWPDSTAWQSKEQAEAWAEDYIESLTNPDFGFIPGDNPQNPRIQV